jgi:hypothetical protein
MENLPLLADDYVSAIVDSPEPNDKLVDYADEMMAIATHGEVQKAICDACTRRNISRDFIAKDEIDWETAYE